MIRPAALLVALAAVACTPVRPVPAVPEALHETAEVPGYSGIRYWGDSAAGALLERVAEQRVALLAGASRGSGRPLEVTALVLSGGGSDGAFGAGLLAGWAERGDRPEFTLVTGISTGAIIAPFVFLGEEFDPLLRDFYTENSTETLVIFTPLAALIGRAFAITDTSPLAERLRAALTPEVVARIAAEHRRGRGLQIGTTNLDAQRPVIWDIGAIAATGRPDAPELIRRIILASSAIPGAFPPVLIEVDAGGETWSELHVDGGVTRQLFLLPPQFRAPAIEEAIRAGRMTGTVFAIRNTKLAPDYEPMGIGVVQVAGRSVSTLIKAAGVADVREVARQAQALGVALNLAAVPESFDVVEQELFDPVYMRALYDLGRRMALDGYPWTDGLAE